MTWDSHASDTEGASLSEEQLAPISDEASALYWHFFDSRNRKGVPSVTTSSAARYFGWTEKKTRALMDEIEDAGFWKKREGHPVFNPGQQPERPVPVWAEPEDPAALARLTPVGRRPSGVAPVNYPTTNHQEPPTTKRNPFGVSPSAGRMAMRTTKREVIDLTDYFAYKVRKAYGGFAPDPINCDAIRANFRRWISQDGIPPERIKAMIDIFTGQRLERDDSKPSGCAPVWKVFLAQRQRLLNAVENQTQHRYKKQYWSQRVEEAGT